LKIILDTNIIIDHLRNVPQATKQLQEIEDENYTGLISVITITELMAAPRMSQQRFQSIKKLLSLFEIINVDSHIAKTAGNLLAKYRASNGLEPMDALIAATAQVNEAVLFTLNKKHFRFIEGLVVINPYLADE
jgi:predicted nucleic acid-binding protein